VKDKEAQVALVEPLISHIAETADALSEEYVGLFEAPARRKSAKNRIEGALRKLFSAIEEYRSQLGLQGKKLQTSLVNIADPIVDKLRRHVEKVILIFMQLIELSLDRIMHKYEVEEFRRSNEKAMAGLSPQLSM
jgi:hypothetical protein